MKPRPSAQDGLSLFQAPLRSDPEPTHPLVPLAGQIDWAQFDATFGETFCEETGAPAKSTRLIVGLLYLKYTFDKSDESVVTRWVENPYWQYFCATRTCSTRSDPPHEPDQVVAARRRIEAERLAHADDRARPASAVLTRA